MKNIMGIEGQKKMVDRREHSVTGNHTYRV